MKSEYFHWLAVHYGTSDTDLFDYDRSMIKNLNIGTIRVLIIV